MSDISQLTESNISICLGTTIATRTVVIGRGVTLG